MGIGGTCACVCKMCGSVTAGHSGRKWVRDQRGEVDCARVPESWRRKLARWLHHEACSRLGGSGWLRASMLEAFLGAPGVSHVRIVF